MIEFPLSIQLPTKQITECSVAGVTNFNTINSSQRKSSFLEVNHLVFNDPRSAAVALRPLVLL